MARPASGSVIRPPALLDLRDRHMLPPTPAQLWEAQRLHSLRHARRQHSAQLTVARYGVTAADPVGMVVPPELETAIETALEHSASRPGECNCADCRSPAAC